MYLIWEDLVHVAKLIIQITQAVIEKASSQNPADTVKDWSDIARRMNKMGISQEVISRLTDLMCSGDYYSIILNSVCDCSKSIRASLSEIEKRFFLNEKNKDFHVAILTDPFTLIYCLKKSLISREALSRLLDQELPREFDIFSLGDEKEILEIITKRTTLGKMVLWGNEKI